MPLCSSFQWFNVQTTPFQREYSHFTKYPMTRNVRWKSHQQILQFVTKSSNRGACNKQIIMFPLLVLGYSPWVVVRIQEPARRAHNTEKVNVRHSQSHCLVCSMRDICKILLWEHDSCASYVIITFTGERKPDTPPSPAGYTQSLGVILFTFYLQVQVSQETHPHKVN